MRTDKNGEEITKTISNKLKFVNSSKFMAASLSNLFNSLSDRIQKIKCADCNKCCLEYRNLKDGLIEFKCLWCNENFPKMFDENLNKRFSNAYKFANQDINKFIWVFESFF